MKLCDICGNAEPTITQYYESLEKRLDLHLNCYRRVERRVKKVKNKYFKEVAKEINDLMPLDVLLKKSKR